MQQVLNETFREELKKLNAAQQEAVGNTEGPMLVIAGPGTGKTQVLAARIGSILLNTDTPPHSILCLTYTEAGTIAMRKRLLQFIGPDAYRVHIHTFHSFGNMVIQENLDYFGLRALEPLSDLEKIEVIHEVIDGFSAGNPLKRYSGEIYYDTTRLDKLFQLMKKENWSSALIRQKIGEYLEDLPTREEYHYQRNGKDYKKGDLKRKAIEEETDRMKALEAAVMAYDVYMDKLKARQRYDFADMILWVIEAFRKDENLLRNYQERYLYYLVDEFQDTSGAQSELLNCLIDYWDNPNVFVVGDDDQSIYAFQDANVRNILRFSEKYESDLKTVMMTENYRSGQAILDLAGSVIQHNRDRLVNSIPGLKKELRAAHPEISLSHTVPVIRTYYHAYHETVHVAQQIRDLHQSGVPLPEIAVLYRNHRQAEDIARYLRVLGIPLNIKKKLNALDQPLVLQLLTILEYIKLERDKPDSGEHLLFGILHYRFFGLKPLDIARMSHEVSGKNYAGRTTSFREEMAKVKKTTPNLFDNGETVNPFRRVSMDIEFWIAQSRELTLQQLLEKIINRGGILSRALSSPDRVWMMEQIHSFFEFVKDECARNTRLSLEEFLERVELMRRNGIELPVHQVSYAADGVNFLTAHSSKGLEFEYVFLISCDSRAWKGRNSNAEFKLPDTLSRQSEVNDDEESRRLFYVALTRAKRHLYISWAEESSGGKPLEKLAYVAEAEAAGIAQTGYISLQDEDLAEFTDKVVQDVALPEVRLIDPEYLNELLKKYTMSVTHLNNYLRCPLSFYFDNLIRVPRAKAPAMSFGSAVHFALERLFKKMIDDPEHRFPGEQQLLRDFEWYMRRNADSFTDKEFELRMEYGRKILPAYYQAYEPVWNKAVSVEKSIKNVEFRGVPINGKIDKIEFHGDEVNVIDYKTGSYDNARSKFKRPDPEADPEKQKFEDEFGGDYWRQAVFYKILIDHDPRLPWKTVSAEFDFVEPDKKTGQFRKEKILITPEDQAIVSRQITETHRRILNHEFDGCGKPDCEWCAFVKNHYALETELGVPEAGEELG